MDKPAAKRQAGAPPKRLKIAGSWEAAVAKSFKVPANTGKQPPRRKKAG